MDSWWADQLAEDGFIAVAPDLICGKGPNGGCTDSAAIVYYGASPSDPAAFEKIRAPVLGLYGGDDARVNATIEPAAEAMKKAAKSYESEIYEGAGHGFLRAQSGREGANLRASEKAWPRTPRSIRVSD